ncbi:hypothetical protein Tco_1492701 [Tanacetum coccineum]
MRNMVEVVLCFLDNLEEVKRNEGRHENKVGAPRLNASGEVRCSKYISCKYKKNLKVEGNFKVEEGLKKERVDERLLEKIDTSFALTIDVHVDPIETKVDDWEFRGLFGVLLVDNVEEQR